MKKLFAGLCIFLMILLPSINANTLLSDKGHFSDEVSKKVDYTENRVNVVDKIFNDIKVKIENVDNQEDCNIIFKEALIELDNYGLLDCISVNEAYKIISSNGDDSYSIYGESTTRSNFFERIGIFFYSLEQKTSILLSLISLLLWHIFLFANKDLIVHRGSWITFGLLHYVRYYLYDAYPSEGYLKIVSSDGETEYNGSFFGNLSFTNILDIQDPMGGHDFYCVGIKGFKGIKIGGYYFGTAEKVNIVTNVPDPYE